MEEKDVILEVKDISYFVREKKIIEDISFSLKRGGFYCVIGTNGSGKTTLLKSITNNVELSSGVVKVNGKSIKKYYPKQLAKEMSIVWQHNEFLFDFSAFQVVMMGRMPYQKLLQADSEKDLEIVHKAMEMTNTWHLRNRSIKQLSGGELQRVMIARALTQESPLMLLDEPISSLDIRHQFDVMELLRKINRENGTTIFIILHNLSLALKYSDKIITLKDGHLVHFGKTRDIINKENIQNLFNVDAEIIDKDNIIINK